MITITVFALTMPPSPMFEQRFEERIDAERFEAFWRGLGECHVRCHDDGTSQASDELLMEVA